jgi:hypothetical protein
MRAKRMLGRLQREKLVLGKTCTRTTRRLADDPTGDMELNRIDWRVLHRRRIRGQQCSLVHGILTSTLPLPRAIQRVSTERCPLNICWCLDLLGATVSLPIFYSWPSA